MEKYIIRDTNSDLDNLEVAVGAPCEFHYADPRSKNFRNKIVLRKVFSLSEDDNGDDKLEGVWVEDKFLRVDPETITETTVPGAHVRTFVLFVLDYELNLVEYEDRLQISVVKTREPEVVYTDYKEVKHFGSIKLLMDECQNDEDIKEFIREVKDL